jgi:hypothetical protein
MSSGAGGGDKLGGIYVDIEARTGNLESDFAKIYRATREVESAITALTAKVKAGEIGYVAYQEALAPLEARKQALTAQFNAAREALDRQSAAVAGVSEKTLAYARKTGALRGEMTETGRSASAFGHKLMVVGQTLDDLQYVGQMGIRPIIGNLMQFSAALGIVLIVGNLVYSNWDKLMSLFGTGKVRTEAEEMEELARKTKLTAEETARLTRYKKEQASIEAIRGDSDAKSESVRAFEELVRNQNTESDSLAERLARRRIEGGKVNAYLTEEEQRALQTGVRSKGKLFGLFDQGLEDVDAGELRNTALARARERAERDIGRAAHDLAARERLAKELQNIDPDLARKLRSTTPEALAKKKRDEEETKKYKEKMEEAEREAQEHNEAVTRRREEEISRITSAAGRRLLREELEASEQFGEENYDAGEFRRRKIREIEQRLVDTGKDRGEARLLATTAVDRMMTESRRQVTERAMAEGISEEEARARMLDEAQVTEADRKRREAEDVARSKIVGLDDRLRDELLLARGTGADRKQSEAAVAERLVVELKRQGISEEEARLIAPDMVREASRRLEEEAFTVGRRTDQAKAPELLAADAMLRSVQQAVGSSDPQKQQVELLRKLYETSLRQEELIRQPRAAVIAG